MCCFHFQCHWHQQFSNMKNFLISLKKTCHDMLVSVLVSLNFKMSQHTTFPTKLALHLERIRWHIPLPWLLSLFTGIPYFWASVLRQPVSNLIHGFHYTFLHWLWWPYGGIPWTYHPSQAMNLPLNINGGNHYLQVLQLLQLPSLLCPPSKLPFVNIFPNCFWVLTCCPYRNQDQEHHSLMPLTNKFIFTLNMSLSASYPIILSWWRQWSSLDLHVCWW